MFDTGKVARPVLNGEQPPHIPQRLMGSIPVVIRLVRPDGEEWFSRASWKLASRPPKGSVTSVDCAVRLRAVTAFPQVVDRGGIDPPTFRFSGEQGYALSPPAETRSEP